MFALPINRIKILPPSSHSIVSLVMLSCLAQQVYVNFALKNQHEEDENENEN